jgi:hypothetical protein
MVKLMKYIVTIGSHDATIDLDGSTGTIVSDEYGSGTISDIVQTNNDLTGKVMLDGHTASFEARLNGKDITGTLRVGWLFSEDFTGTQVA